ncbi:hypothetical protein C8R46DRAFT_1040336 [Mycena filopes]|nr:hypothetical protein C8R46DRAFT_1040332 [Mycena filopes]KAJ7157303.1 hypothetical protein C8R46DRAFT_1040334 [Mycena filopes]KAJ7157305.1 hypothetical protein C8R46DRAFT_1040336 [Mycena filopes]
MKLRGFSLVTALTPLYYLTTTLSGLSIACATRTDPSNGGSILKFFFVCVLLGPQRALKDEIRVINPRSKPCLLAFNHRGANADCLNEGHEHVALNPLSKIWTRKLCFNGTRFGLEDVVWILRAMCASRPSTTHPSPRRRIYAPIQLAVVVLTAELDKIMHVCFETFTPEPKNPVPKLRIPNLCWFACSVSILTSGRGSYTPYHKAEIMRVELQRLKLIVGDVSLGGQLADTDLNPLPPHLNLDQWKTRSNSESCCCGRSTDYIHAREVVTVPTRLVLRRIESEAEGIYIWSRARNSIQFQRLGFWWN